MMTRATMTLIVARFALTQCQVPGKIIPLCRWEIEYRGRMARRIDINRIIQSQFVSDLPLVMAGCAIAALATDVFMIPNGLAAGGLTGLATIVAELGRRAGVNLPVGMQTIVMNALLLLVVVRSGGLKYVVQTVTGFVLFGFFTDLFAPFVLHLSHDDIMLSALWGGIVSGIGYGLVFRCGANTGGSDTIGQIIARKSSLPVGATVMAIDVAVCAASAPVFSVSNALYAALSMVLMGYVVDMVVDGGNSQRAAFIISDAYEEIEHDILHAMDRGCTRLMAQGSWTKKDRPVLFFIFSRREISIIKTVVYEHDADAMLIITDVNEAIGYGFKSIA